ncbi:MAG: hypothetical protein ACRC8K_06145, partial [Waterburya sp.]
LIATSSNILYVITLLNESLMRETTPVPTTEETSLRVQQFAYAREPFRHLLMGETPKTAMPHHRNCFTATDWLPKIALVR